MRVKNAISGMLLLVLGFTVGSAAAMLVTAPVGNIGSTNLSHDPAVMTLDHNWNITGIVMTPDHHSNITETEINKIRRNDSNRAGSIATPQPRPCGKQTLRADLLMLAVIVAGGHRSSPGSP
jgi:hypothetical protein